MDINNLQTQIMQQSDQAGSEKERCTETMQTEQQTTAAELQEKEQNNSLGKDFVSKLAEKDAVIKVLTDQLAELETKVEKKVTLPRLFVGQADSAKEPGNEVEQTEQQANMAELQEKEQKASTGKELQEASEEYTRTLAEKDAEIKDLQEASEEHTRTLAEKDAEIKDLQEASEEHTRTLAEKDAEIKALTDQVAEFETKVGSEKAPCTETVQTERQITTAKPNEKGDLVTQEGSNFAKPSEEHTCLLAEKDDKIKVLTDQIADLEKRMVKYRGQAGRAQKQVLQLQEEMCTMQQQSMRGT